jgi:hypothetical protein
MERVIQLFDELDDLLAPALAFPTFGQWLRGFAVVVAMALFASAGSYWTLAAVLSVPALPVALLLHESLRRALPMRPDLPRRIGFQNEL